MGYIATRLGKVPSGYGWYIFLMLDNWNDEIREELLRNFESLAAAVGPDVLVVKGAYAERLNREVAELYGLSLHGVGGHVETPALVVTDTSPEDIIENPDMLKQKRVMIFPLKSRYLGPGSVTEFLQELVATILVFPDRIPRGVDEVSKAGLRVIIRRWLGWIPKYLELKPNFFGFGVNFNEVLEEVLGDERKKRKH